MRVDPELLVVTDRIEGWHGRVRSVEALHGGFTNRNLKVSLDDGSAYVVRLGGSDTHLLGIDRHVEHAAQRAAAAAGIAPAAVAFVQPEGWLVSEFVDGEPVPDLGDPEVVAQVGSLLARMHALPPLATEFGCFAIGTRYDATARARGASRHPSYERAMEICACVEAVFRRVAEPLVAAHNDLLAGNFLLDRTGRVWIIDWEYAAMNSRWFDLGNLVVNNGLDDDARDALVRAYLDDVGLVSVSMPAAAARTELMTVVSDVREAMWGVVQSAIGTLDIDYLAYADTHFDRLLERAGTARFRRALKEATA